MVLKEAIPWIFDYLGTLFIGVAVLRVHMKMRKDKKIDRYVLEDIRKEQVWTIFGIFLITIGLLLKIFS